MSNSSWESNNFSTIAIALEKVLNIWSQRIRTWEKNDIVLLRGTQYIIVEVINHERVSVCREMDIEFEEE